MSNLEFERLKAQIADGSRDAVATIVERHSDSIARVIRRWLGRRMRSQFDTLDFQQIVWASLLENLEILANCETPEELQGRLARVARGKVVDAFRKMASRDARTTTLDCRSNDGANFHRTVYANDPTPSHVVRTREEHDILVERLPERYRKMIDLYQEGSSYVEIARQLGVHERTVRRLFAGLAGGECS